MNKNTLHHSSLLPLGEGKKIKCISLRKNLDEGSWISKFGACSLLLVTFIWCLLLGNWSFSAEFVPGEIIVKYKPGRIKSASVEKLQKKFQVIEEKKIFGETTKIKANIKTQSQDQFYLSNIYKLKFQPDVNVSDAVKEYKKDPSIEYAEPNYIYHAFNTPNDPDFLNVYSSSNPGQWGLYKISAEAAWSVTTGSTDVIIAIIDTGVDYNHSDLSANIARKADGSINGYDFVTATADLVAAGEDYAPADSDPMDVQGHGTHVAGIASAATNNGVGIAGVGWSCKIMPLRAGYKDSGGDGSFLAADIAEAIRYAADNGADVISMSFGSPNYSSLLQDIVNYATGTTEEELGRAYTQKDCILVAAAGNDNKNEVNYPAGYSHVIAVGATDNEDRPAVWTSSKGSNYGSWVSIAAPGSNIYSTAVGGGYKYLSGTSMATPIMAGVAAMIRAKVPTLTNAQIKTQLLTAEACDSVNYTGASGKLLGVGRVNMLKAVNGGMIADITSPSADAYVKGTITISGTAWSGSFQSFTLEAYPASNPSSSEIIASSTAAVTDGTLGTWNTTSKTDGSYTLKLTTTNTSSITASDTVAIVIDNTPPICQITFPISGDSNEGRNVNVTGTASDANLDYYKLEYGEGSSPTTYYLLSYSTASATRSTLYTWDTIGLNGAYTIKLSAADKAGSLVSQSILLNLTNASSSRREIIGSLSVGPIPFNPKAQPLYITYTLSGNFNTQMYIFDLTGNLICKNSYLAGEEGGRISNTISWNGKDRYGQEVANGVYFYRIVSDSKVLSKGKILILK